jgi:hypothetical protein
MKVISAAATVLFRPPELEKIGLRAVTHNRAPFPSRQVTLVILPKIRAEFQVFCPDLSLPAWVQGQEEPSGQDSPKPGAALKAGPSSDSSLF